MYVEGFASKLKKSRANTGFTQREVAKEIGIAQSVLARYETGKGEPSIEILGALADFYQISLDWLLGTAYNKQTQQEKRKEPIHQNPLKLYVSARDNIVNENGNMYIELTPEQMKKLRGINENT